MARTTVALALVLLIAVSVGPVLGQAGQSPTLQRGPMVTQELRFTPLVRMQYLQNALQGLHVSKRKQDAITSQFRELPEDLQNSILAVMNGDYALATNQDGLHMVRLDTDRLRQLLERMYRISSIWPPEGSPGCWAYAHGGLFDSNCQVYFDGSPVTTHYLGWEVEFFPNTLAFLIPTGASRGADHQVYVHSNATGKNTPVFMYPIIAPRGYRGYWGWKFHNFGDPTIPWHLYRHYFGAAAVEYADGTHRPAAQAWYDNAYKGAGGGGNCFGMSVSSLRVRNSNYDHVYHAAWFTNPATHKSYLWDYDWCTESKETVQQMQGSWYTQEQLDAYTAADAAQDARGTYNRVASLVSDSVNRPVLVYWGNGWGHAVVPYAVRVNGDRHEMLCYDNNNPYRKNETGDVDPSVATVFWSSNSFSCGGGTSATAVSYQEVTPANPHLPGAEYGGPGATTVVLVASASTKVNQITDENGRTLLNPDGSKNEDPNTGIPNASILYPLVQAQPLEGPTVLHGQVLSNMGQVLQPRIPNDSPTLYVFRQATGKSLLVNFAGQGEKQLSFFQPGAVLQVRANGAGQVQMANILGARFSGRMLNPAGLQLAEVQMIDSEAAGDRVFLLHNLTNLSNEPLEIIRIRRGQSLEVLGGPNLKFDLQVQGPVGRGMQTGTFRSLSLESGAKLQIAPEDWSKLRSTQLNVRFLNITNEQLLHQIRIGGN